MEPEDTTVEYDFIVNEPVEPKADDAVYYEPLTDEPAPEQTAWLTGTELCDIYLMIKSVRRGDWGHGDARIDNMSEFGFDDNAIVAVIHAADQ